MEEERKVNLIIKYLTACYLQTFHHMWVVSVTHTLPAGGGWLSLSRGWTVHEGLVGV